MVFAVLGVLAGVAGGITPPPETGFSPVVRKDIVRRVLTLMPSALQNILDQHRSSLEEGLISESGPATPESLIPAVQDVVSALDRHAPMNEVARRMGRLARVSSGLAWGLGGETQDPRASIVAPDFRRYIENQLPRIAVTFAGYLDPNLARGNLTDFGRAIAARAGQDLPGIMRSYFPEGRRRLPEDFDDRSVAFAAASLEVSLALTATARAWLFAWHRAGGDLTGTWSAYPLASDNPFREARTLPPPAAPPQETTR